MKAEELLQSLDHVGEDLLAEAEQNVLVRRRRPWLKGAAAAVLVLALGAGGFLLLRDRLGRQSPMAGSDPPATVTMPDISPGDALPALTVGDSFTGVFTLTMDRSCLNRQLDDWTGAPALTRLPVYRSGMVYTCQPAQEGLPCLYGPDQLQALLEAAAERLGASLSGQAELSYDEEHAAPTAIQAETDQGTLSVYGDGRVLMLFDEAHRIQATVKLSADEEDPDALSALRLASMEDCGENVRALLGLPECRLALWDYWNAPSSAYHACCLYPVREDPAKQLLARYWEGVRFLSADGRNVWGLEWYCAPDSQGAPARPDWLEALGDYPILSPEAARAALEAGQFLYEGADRDSLDLAAAQAPELLYLTESPHSLYLPFYRFLVPVSEAEGAVDYAVLYVPAVDPAFLTDFPALEQSVEPSDEDPETTAPTDSGPEPSETAVTEPEPTQPPDGYQPMPAGTNEEGMPMLAGPAGAVEALHWMDSQCRDPVWADLDGDGFRELIYWNYGPTSGLFTAGICVYGLEEGWPVLKAAQIYNLRSGELSLSKEGGRVYFLHTPYRYSPEQGDPSPDQERRYAVTLRDGRLLLEGEGEADPDALQLWGGDKWFSFGRSFARLREQTQGQWLFDHPACLVWRDPEESANGQHNIYAALCGNGVSVTGFLSYEPMRDGSWFCASWGVEPIETPEDPAALEALSPEELEARLGPCHFDWGHELRIPCWFTRDGHMLVVTYNGQEVSAGLRVIGLPPVDN